MRANLENRILPYILLGCFVALNEHFVQEPCNLVLCFRAALDRAYETLKATDGSGVNFQDFLLLHEGIQARDM